MNVRDREITRSIVGLAFPRWTLPDLDDQEVYEYPDLGRQHVGFGVDEPQDVVLGPFVFWQDAYELSRCKLFLNTPQRVQ